MSFGPVKKRWVEAGLVGLETRPRVSHGQGTPAKSSCWLKPHHFMTAPFQFLLGDVLRVGVSTHLATSF